MRIWSQGRGFCSGCGVDCALGSVNGAPAVAATHKRVRSGMGHPLKERCPGSGQPPREVIAVKNLKQAISKTRKTRNTKSHKKREAWREARVQHYRRTRSAESLARMVVDLEDAGNHVPEFEIDEEWPS